MLWRRQTCLRHLWRDRQHLTQRTGTHGSDEPPSLYPGGLPGRSCLMFSVACYCSCGSVERTGSLRAIVPYRTFVDSRQPQPALNGCLYCEPTGDLANPKACQRQGLGGIAYRSILGSRQATQLGVLCPSLAGSTCSKCRPFMLQRWRARKKIFPHFRPDSCLLVAWKLYSFMG